MKQFVQQFLLLFAILTSVSSQTPNITLTNEKSQYSWTNNDATSITIAAEYGYQIQVEATKIRIDGENGDFIIINQNKESAILFSYTVSGKPIYLYNSNEITASYVASNASNANEFLIKFTQVGEARTTTELTSPTTTTPVMPTAAPDESATLNVYLYGKAAADFNEDDLKNLRKSIALMGQQYCSDQNCPLNESISINNVKIDILKACPIIWENQDKCANLTFALPIVKDENKANSLWDGYQLNEANLQFMWQNYAEKFLKSINLKLYTEPNVKAIFTVRLIVIGSVTLILIGLIVIFRRCVGKLNKRQRKLSDTLSIVNPNQASNRTSQLSLTPHYLQELPPLFSNDFPLHPVSERNKPFFSNDGNMINLNENNDNNEPEELFEDAHA